VDNLAGRTIIITGVGRRGQVSDAIAEALGAAGARLVLLGHRPNDVEERAAEARARGGTVIGHACDLTNEAEVGRVAGAVAASDPEVDALVNGAGGFAYSGNVPEASPDLLDRQFAMNVRSAFLATRAFLPLVRRRRGSIIFFASAAATEGVSAAGMSAYVAAKSAVIGLMRAVAQEEMANGVRANALAPAAMRTPANEEAMGKGGPFVELGAMTSIVRFLCSDASRALTGQVMRIG